MPRAGGARPRWSAPCWRDRAAARAGRSRSPPSRIVAVDGDAVRHALPGRAAVDSTDPANSLTTTNASSTPYTLTIMTWVAVVFTPIVLAYQGWTYWVFRKRHQPRRHPGRTPACRSDGSGLGMKPLDPRLLRYARRRAAVHRGGLPPSLGRGRRGLIVVQATLLAGVLSAALPRRRRPAATWAPHCSVVLAVGGRAGAGWPGRRRWPRTASAAAVKCAAAAAALVAHVLRLGPRHPDLPATGELATLATRGLDALDGYFARYLPQLVARRGRPGRRAGPDR